jgi:hypothetical protein
MTNRHVWLAAIGVMGLAWSGLSAAQQYRPDEFLSLDLPSAVLSPKPLGPAATFTPGPLDVTIDRKTNAAQANAEPAAKTEPDMKAEPVSINKTALKSATSGHRVALARVERPAHAARTALALHRRNPVDAEASDARVQVWPCKSGGICNWKR